MNSDEIERLKEKISRAEVNEQIEIAELLINELIINNEFFEYDEYNYEKSNECIENLTSLTEKIKNKIESRKIKSLRKRFNDLPKSKQKIILNELLKLISNIEKKSINKNNKCKDEGHLFSGWGEHTYITEHLKKDDNNHKNFVNCEASYWIRKCERCGYEQKTEKEPEEITHKKEKELNNASSKQLKKYIN